MKYAQRALQSSSFPLLLLWGLQYSHRESILSPACTTLATFTFAHFSSPTPATLCTLSSPRPVSSLKSPSDAFSYYLGFSLQFFSKPNSSLQNCLTSISFKPLSQNLTNLPCFSCLFSPLILKPRFERIPQSHLSFSTLELLSMQS